MKTQRTASGTCNKKKFLPSTRKTPIIIVQDQLKSKARNSKHEKKLHCTLPAHDIIRPPTQMRKRILDKIQHNQCGEDQCLQATKRRIFGDTKTEFAYPYHRDPVAH